MAWRGNQVEQLSKSRAALQRMRADASQLCKRGGAFNGREFWNRNAGNLKVLANTAPASFRRVAASVPDPGIGQISSAPLEHALDEAATVVKSTADAIGGTTSAALQLRQATTQREKVAAVENVVTEMIGDAIRRARKGGT